MSRLLRIALVMVGAALATGGVVLALLWQSRAQLSDLPLSEAPSSDQTANRVTVTWLGISTLLFDDGETQIITDATITRPRLADILLFRPLQSDIAAINRVLDEFDIDRLEAIVPLHSHFDHVMDAGQVANRTGAMILGSESTANVARGAGVPVDQYQILQTGESRYFGKFTVTLLASRHVPQLGDGPVFPGTIETPLLQPARVSAWRTGIAYTLLLSHPAGSILVQGSAGFVDGGLDAVDADTAFLSIAGIHGHGRDYARRYWQQVVGATGASRVFAIHFEDFTQPFGVVELLPDLVDDVVSTAGWLTEFAAAADRPVDILRPPFGEPVVLFGSADSPDSAGKRSGPE